MAKATLLNLLEAENFRKLSPALKALLGKERRRVTRLWLNERQIWAEHPEAWVVGADEVGRGPLAGPLVAAAVAFRATCFFPGLNDSKKLAPRERELLAERIRAADVRFCITEIPVHDISNGNLHYLSLHAMEASVRGLGVEPAMVFIDGRHELKSDQFPQRSVVGGDGKCASIAAASIIAKVFRDAKMVAWDSQYPGYFFAQNKGYATADHRKALKILGPSPIHRLNFRPVRMQTNEQLDLFDKGAAGRRRSRKTGGRTDAPV